MCQGIVFFVYCLILDFRIFWLYWDFRSLFLRCQGIVFFVYCLLCIVFFVSCLVSAYLLESPNLFPSFWGNFGLLSGIFSPHVPFVLFFWSIEYNCYTIILYILIMFLMFLESSFSAFHLSALQVESFTLLVFSMSSAGSLTLLSSCFSWSPPVKFLPQKLYFSFQFVFCCHGCLIS